MKQKTHFFSLLLTATILLVISGCKKNSIESHTSPLSGAGSRAGTLGTTPDVYVAGSLNGQAAYWKNGQVVILTGGSQASGIVVVGTDVYVSGWGTSPTTFQFVAQYWKNGVLTNLTNGSSSALATGIYVSGTDVYVSGYTGAFVRTAAYWKNGVMTSLGSGQASGISVSTGGDIYVSNRATAPGGPTYWKNGTLTSLPGNANSFVTAITVQGSHVYAVGTNDNISTQAALYWKDGVAQTMFPRQNTEAMAVALSSTGQAVISGTSGPSVDSMLVVFWDILGDLHVLSRSTAEFVSTSTGIAMDQSTGDVYVCGSEFNNIRTGPSYAKYWYWAAGGSSAAEVVLSDGSSNATANAITLGQ